MQCVMKEMKLGSLWPRKEVYKSWLKALCVSASNVGSDCNWQNIMWRERYSWRSLSFRPWTLLKWMGYSLVLLHEYWDNYVLDETVTVICLKKIPCKIHCCNSGWDGKTWRVLTTSILESSFSSSFALYG